MSAASWILFFGYPQSSSPWRPRSHAGAWKAVGSTCAFWITAFGFFLAASKWWFLLIQLSGFKSRWVRQQGGDIVQPAILVERYSVTSTDKTRWCQGPEITICSVCLRVAWVRGRILKGRTGKKIEIVDFPRRADLSENVCINLFSRQIVDIRVYINIFHDH